MAVSFADIAEKIMTLPEIDVGDSVLMDTEIPNGMKTALEGEGLTVTRTDFAGLTSFNVDIVFTTNTNLINKAINNKKITNLTQFLYLIMIQETPVEGDLEENFETFKTGRFTFTNGETLPYSVWKLVRVWVNQ